MRYDKGRKGDRAMNFAMILTTVLEWAVGLFIIWGFFNEDKLISFLQITKDNTPDGKSPQIPFSTTALSDYLCVNRSALQREIAKLKKSGVLTISKRKFRLAGNND